MNMYSIMPQLCRKTVPEQIMETPGAGLANGATLEQVAAMANHWGLLHRTGTRGLRREREASGRPIDGLGTDWGKGWNFAAKHGAPSPAGSARSPYSPRGRLWPR